MIGASPPGPAWATSARTAVPRLRVLFTGRSTGPPPDTLSRVEPTPPSTSWARQVHGATVLEARPGAAGDGDALVTDQRGLALAVTTADCVPVLMAGPRRIAAVHAGWRGIVAGVVPAALRAIDAAPAEVAAWLGPAIGVCCYEVGGEVAGRIAAASSPAAVREGTGRRPHADLQAAVRVQLEREGVRAIEAVSLCTRCESERLSSYRRDGPGGDRNFSYVWLEA